VRRSDGGAPVVDVGHAAAAWLRTRAPAETAPAAAEAFLRAVLEPSGARAETAAASGPRPFEAVRTKILPLVLHPAFFLTTDEAAPDAPPILRFQVVEDELSAAIVVPGEAAPGDFLSGRLLSGADLARYDRTLDALRTEAMANLASRVKGKVSIALSGGAVARVEAAPCPRATLVLVSEVRARLVDALGEEALIAIPARDTLVAIAPRARAGLRDVLSLLAREYEEAAHPLSSALFLATREGLSFAGRLQDAAAPLDGPARPE
jgi:hypothetical protein